MVSTCEELLLPSLGRPKLANELARLALLKQAVVLGTGVNPHSCLTRISHTPSPSDGRFWPEAASSALVVLGVSMDTPPATRLCVLASGHNRLAGCDAVSLLPVENFPRISSQLSALSGPPAKRYEKPGLIGSLSRDDPRGPPPVVRSLDLPPQPPPNPAQGRLEASPLPRGLCRSAQLPVGRRHQPDPVGTGGSPQPHPG